MMRPIVFHLDRWKVTISFKELKSRRPNGRPNQESIIDMVCRKTNVSFHAIRSRARPRAIFEARVILCNMLSKMCELNTVEIARIIRKDHTAVSYEQKLFGILYATDPRFRRIAESVETGLLDSIVPSMPKTAPNPGGRGSPKGLGGLLHEVGGMRIVRDERGTILAAVQDELPEPPNGEAKGVNKCSCPKCEGERRTGEESRHQM